MPLYNKQESIRFTIESILHQSYNRWELVIIDDGSSDQSISIVKSIYDQRIKVYTKSNGGPSSARNLGVKRAIYDWIIFFDADDIMPQDSLLHYVEAINKSECADILVGNYYLVDKSGRRLMMKEGCHFVKSPFRSWFLGTLCPCTGNCLYKRNNLLHEPYNESLRRYEDVELMLRLFKNARIFKFDSVVMEYNRQYSSASKPRHLLSEDYIGNLDLHSGTFWERAIKYELFIQGKNVYTQECKKIYKKEDKRYDWKLIFRLLLIYRKNIGNIFD